MKNPDQIFHINLDITSQNADEYQCEYICDVVNPLLKLQEIIELATEKGYIFGNGSQDNAKLIGLYRKLT